MQPNLGAVAHRANLHATCVLTILTSVCSLFCVSRIWTLVHAAPPPTPTSRAPVESSEVPTASAEMAPAAVALHPSRLTSLLPSLFSSPLLVFLASCVLLLSCPASAGAESSTKNCSASGDPCQEGGSVSSARRLWLVHFVGEELASRTGSCTYLCQIQHGESVKAVGAAVKPPGCSVEYMYCFEPFKESQLQLSPPVTESNTHFRNSVL